MTGILDIPSDQYHADAIADAPTLSASIAKILIAQSPAHAYAAHPRLNEHYQRDDDPKFDVGNVFHAVFLEGRDVVEPLAFPDWRTAAAKALREEVRAEGRIPLLVAQWQEVQTMLEAVRAQLPGLDVQPPMFGDGKPEQTLVWEEEGVTCRARLDWLRDDGAAIDDFKTTSRSANPELFSRTLFQMGYDVQAAFYLRGLRAVTGADAEFRFVVVETSPPYALSVVSLLPAALELANDKCTYAIRKWRDCLAGDAWPGYPSRVCYAEAPGWAEAQWMEKEAREAA